MRKKSLFLIFILVCSFTLTMTKSSVNHFDGKEYSVVSADSVDADVSVQAEEETVTIRDIEMFLKDKKEHYPLSDEFIERYQQASGGYIGLAKSLGLAVDKEKHEPNQKWHFFDSWLYPSIEDGSITYDADAKKRVYTNLLCPELLLWIYEASGVDPVKVKAAKDVAEQGKAASTNVSTVASNMRKCVPWDDIANAIRSQDYTTQTVTVNAGNGFTVTGIQNEHRVGSQVSFTVNVTDSTKEVAEVKVNNDVLTAVSGNTYKFAMPDEEVIIYVTLKDIPPTITLSKKTLTLAVGSEKTITATVEPCGTTESAVWSVIDGQGVITIVPNGNEVTIRAIATGTAKINVSYNESLTADCIIAVKEPGDPSLNTSAKYDIVYDLGTGKQAKKIETDEDVFNVFKFAGEGGEIITSVSRTAYIYGGGNGKVDNVTWYGGDMLKIGTTTNNGTLTVALNTEVNRVIITGYVSNKACKIKVGDSNSTDWTDETNDNKTTTVTCSDMVEACKEIVDGKQTASIVIDITSTGSITIATTNKRPIYITSIEFVYVESEQ